jgi:chromosome segregation ATPase
MNLDDAPSELEEFFDRVHVALDREITRAKEIVAAANAEKASAQSALADLQDQHKQAQTDLKSARAYLQRGSTLAGLDGEITAQRKTLDAGKLEKAELEKALAKVTKQLAERQAQVNALAGEVSQLSARRVHDQEVMAKIRHQLGV